MSTGTHSRNQGIYIAGLLVEDSEVHCEATFGEAVHDGVVGSKAMCISSFSIRHT